MPWKQKPFGWGKALSGESLFPPVQGATVAVLNRVKEIVREDPSIDGITFNVDSLEPPSVGLAIQTMLDNAKSTLSFECVASSVPEPDPRSSTARRPLWKYSGNLPVVAVPEPAKGQMQDCAEIVSKSKDCFESWDFAKERSPLFGVDQVDFFLAVMVFPPANPSEFEATEWVRRIQLTAAQLAVNIEKLNGVTIADSRVADMTNGPLDWTIDSAMVALAQRVTEECELVGEVREIVKRVAARVPADGTWSCGAVADGVLKYLDTVTQLSETSAER